MAHVEQFFQGKSTRDLKLVLLVRFNLLRLSEDLGTEYTNELSHTGA